MPTYETQRSGKGDARVAALVAFSVIATQVGGKSIRDALFLATFGVEALPRIVALAAVLSIAVALLATRSLVRLGPERALAGALAASAFVHLVLCQAFEAAPRVVAVLLYLHVAVGGAMLVTWFWSLVNERFDPRAAKHHIGRIAGGAAFGGVAGGLLAERIAAFPSLSIVAALPVLAALQGVSAARIVAIWARTGRVSTEVPGGEDRGESGLAVIRRTPYLRDLALLVLVVAVAGGWLDFVFKARAVAHVADDRALLRLFAVFHTTVGAATLAAQWLFARVCLERYGLSRTGALLPAASGLGSLALLAPALSGLLPALVVRGGAAVLLNSLFRSSYELFYTPLVVRQKRAAKALVDVACDRLGDLLGAGAILVVLYLADSARPDRGGLHATDVLLVGCALASGVALVLLARLERGYRCALASSLVEKAVVLDAEDVVDGSTRTVYLETIRVSRPGAAGPSSGRTGATPPAPLAESMRVGDAELLRTGDAERVRARLESDEDLDARAVPHAIRLLGWDDVARSAIRALRRTCDRDAGTLVAALLDPEEEFAVRRRVPRVLTASSSERVVAGLQAGLRDARFEVRYNCAAALARIRARSPRTEIDRASILAAVLAEARRGRRIWMSARIIEELDPAERAPIVTEVLAGRSSAILTHVFTLLSLVLPPEPLRVAFLGLHAGDSVLRGTALEYLDVTLPTEIRSALWPMLERGDTPSVRASRSTAEILEDLLGSHASIQLDLERAAEAEDGPA